MTDRLSESMKRVGEVAGGVSVGEFLTSGLEQAAQLIERMADGLKEFAKSSLEVRASREVLQNQQRSMLESQGKAALGPELDKLVRDMEGRETMIRYERLVTTSNQLLSAAPQRFQNVEQIHKMLGQLADVSRTLALWDLASHSLTTILAEGQVDAQHLRELSVDTG
jgi:hypothetical protein